VALAGVSQGPGLSSDSDSCEQERIRCSGAGAPQYAVAIINAFTPAVRATPRGGLA
jgi:hypothetical protein